MVKPLIPVLAAILGAILAFVIVALSRAEQPD